jgi:hypothetical protein
MDSIQRKRNVSVWRLAAVIICMAWMIDFLVRIFVLEIGPREQDLLPFPFSLYFYAVAGVVLIVSMFFPRELYILGGLCWLWGLLRVIDGNSIAAVGVHLLGYLFLFMRGLFRTHFRAKVIVASLIFIAAFVSQIRYGVKFLAECGLQLFDFSMLVVIAVLIFYPERRNSTTPLMLCLDATRFTAQDVAILQKILSNEKYQRIASEYGMGTSTFKKRIGGLYAEIGVQDRMDFMSRYARHTIELSPSSRESVTPPATALR